MTEFDAELHLRLLGERELMAVEPDRHHRSSPLDLPAAGLVVCGAIAAADAHRVIEDYTAATRVRAGERNFPHYQTSSRRRRPGPMPVREMRVIDRQIPFDGGQLLLRYLALGATRSQLYFHWRAAAPQTRGTRRMMIGGPGGFAGGRASPPVILDDRGHRPAVHSGSGGGSGGEWTGTFELHGALSAQSAWLEVDGVKVPLARTSALRSVQIEPLPEEPALERFLWRHLAVGETPFGRPRDLEPMLETLIAAGVVDPEERLLGELRAVTARMPQHPRHPHGGGRSSSRGLAEPWRSLVGRLGRGGGPSLSLPIGAFTPEFDGIRLAVLTLSSDEDGFEIEFEATPNVLHPPALGELPVAWWARDERGNHHLGSPSGWSGSDDHARGTLRFWPALDPRATVLELLPSADTSRAVITIDLTQTEQP